jgi:Amidohydrolase family
MRRILKWLAATFGLVVITFAVAVIWPVPPAPLASDVRDHIIANVHVIDTQSGQSGPIQTVTIINGRIAAIGAAPTVPSIPVIDGKGGYLIPGLWDMHSHSLQISPQLHFPLYLANGVTGVRDMMDCPKPNDALIACVADKRRWTAEAAAGKMVAPRFVGVASFYFEDETLTPDDVSRLVADYAPRKLDYLKVYNNLSRAAYFRLAEDAKRSGMPLVGHIPKSVTLTEAVEAGQKSVEHGHALIRHCFNGREAWMAGRLDAVSPTKLAAAMVERHDDAACERVFAAMKAGGTWLVPTHLTREEDARAGDREYLADTRLGYADPLSRWAWRDDAASTVQRYSGAAGQKALRDYFDFGLVLTGRAQKAGVRVLVGTDTILSGFKIHDEMELLVRAGLTPAEVLKAATIDAAEFAGQQAEFGTVSVGKAADLVLLARNPLDKIGNTRSISSVFFAGQHYDRQSLNALMDYTKSQTASPANWAKMLWGFATSSVSGTL